MLINPFSNTDKSKWLVNLSNKKIPENIINVLSLGEKFGLPVTQIDKRDRINTVIDITKNLETMCHKIPKDLIESATSEVMKSVHGYF